MQTENTEQRETLQAEVCVSFRRLGMNRVHFALVMPDTITEGSIFGSPCAFVAAPISTFCSRTLRGRCVVIPPADADSWRRNGHVCRECVLIAQQALERADA